MSLKYCEFYENQSISIRTVLKGVNEILSYCVHFSSGFDTLWAEIITVFIALILISRKLR